MSAARRRGLACDPVTGHLQHLQTRGLSPVTILARRLHLGRLARHLDVDLGPDLLLADEGDLEEWQRTIAHLSASYRSNSAAHLREFYRWARTAGYIDEDPAVSLVGAKPAQRMPHPIDPVDLDQALSTASERVRPMLILAAYAGLRACEIAQLTRQQVRDQDDPPVLVVIGKGNKERVIPVSQLVLDELHRYGLPTHGPVFGWGDGRPGAVTPGRVSSLCSEHLHRQGIPESLHKLRHFYGTAMYRASKDLQMVQRVMGHTSPSVTIGYVAYSQDDAYAAATAIALRAAGGPPRSPLALVRDPGEADDGTSAAPLTLVRDPGRTVPAPTAAAAGAARPAAASSTLTAGRLGSLTAREVEVLQMVADGLSNKAAALKLGLSAATVKTHLDNIGPKIGARNRASMVALAMRQGLVA